MGEDAARPLRALIIEDSEDDLLLLLRELRKGGYAPSCERIDNADAMREALGRREWDVIISDYVMPKFSGMAALNLLKKSGIDIPFIIVSGKIGEEVAVAALKAGAHDYIIKGSLGRLVPAIDRELREALSRRERRAAQEALQQYRDHLEDLVRERTAELRDLNRQLSREVLERTVIEEELRTHRDHLEELVADRTSALQQANAELEQEIRERRESERRLGMTNTLLGLFAQKFSRKEYLESVARLISQWSGCSSLGIRVLAPGGTIPYEASTGFSGEFLESEGCLSLCRDECVCTRVLGGRTEAQDLPARTNGGSFVVNDFPGFLESLRVQEKSRYRHACLNQGFQSMAVIPLCYHQEILGAIHIADRRPEVLPRASVEFLEMLSLIIGEAIHRFNAEEALRSQSRMVESFFNHSVGPLAFLDREFNFIRVNEAYAKACGRDVAEFPGRNHFELYPDEENKAIFSSVVESKATYRTYARPFEFPDHPEWGTTYWDWTLTPLLDDRGEADVLVFALNDVTEQTRLRSVAEAVNTMNNIGYVFAGIRHEIGNPINSAKMALSVLKANFDRYGRDDIMTYLDRTSGELSRVEYLLKCLKNFNLFETPEFQRLDIRAFIEKFVSLVREDCAGRGVDLAGTCDADVDCIMADPRALHQVLLNVVTNALDACTDAAQPRIAIGVQRAFGFVLIKVSDNGRGMSEEQQKNLFRPFFTTKQHGTGLGLVITRKMVLNMKGTISVSSRAGSGTSVDILLQEGKTVHA